MNCGVYQIKHVASGRVYVGSSMNISRRLKWHRTALERGGHHSPKLQRAWAKYGAEAFEFSVLLFCSADMRLFYEQIMMDALDVVNAGWNCSTRAASPVVPVTPESRKRLSVALRSVAKKYEWKGQSLCIAEIAELEGISAKLLDKRLTECGWSLQRAAETASNGRNVQLPGFGKLQTFKEWAAELAVLESTLRNRVKAGATIEQIANSQKRISLGELARVTGWSAPVFMSRVRAGWDVGDALMVPPHTGKRGAFKRNGVVNGAREIAL